MAPTTEAIFRAVADFRSLNRALRQARRNLDELKASARDTSVFDSLGDALDRLGNHTDDASGALRGLHQAQLAARRSADSFRTSIQRVGAVTRQTSSSLSGMSVVQNQVVNTSNQVGSAVGSLGNQLDNVASRSHRATLTWRDFIREGSLFGRLISSVQSSLSGGGSSISRFSQEMQKATRTGQLFADMLRFIVLRSSILIPALGLLTVILSGVVNAVEQLSGIVGLLPGGLFAAGLAVATLLVGLQGFGKGLQAIGEDTAAFEEAIKDLAPSAQETLRAIRSFREEYQAMQKVVQQVLFQDVADDIYRIGTLYLPILETGMVRVATAINGAWKNIVAFLTEARTVEDIGQAFFHTGTIIDNLAVGIQPLLRVLRDVGVVGIEALAQVSGGFGGVLERFANFVAAARADGSLRAWVDRGIQAVRDLWNILRNIWMILTTIFDAFDIGGRGFIAVIREMTASWLAFIQSAEGQKTLQGIAQTFIAIAGVLKDVLIVALKELGPVLIELLPFIKAVAAAFGTTMVIALQILGPILQALAVILSALGPVLGPIIGTLLAFGLVIRGVGAGIHMLLGVFRMMGIGIGGLQLAFAALTGGGTKLAAGIAAVGRGFVAVWALMSRTAMAHAVRIAAAWLIAMGPVGWAIAAVIGIGALLYAFWPQISMFLQQVWIGIQAAWQSFWTVFQTTFASAWATIVAGFWSVIGWFQTLPGTIVNLLASMGTSILNFFTALPGQIGYWLGYLVVLGAMKAMEFVVAVVLWFQQLPGRIITYVAEMVVGAIAWFTDMGIRALALVTQMILGVISWFQSLPGKIVALIAQGITGVISWFQQLPGKIIGFTAQAIVGVVNWFQQLPGKTASLVSQAVNGVINWFQSLPAKIINMASRFFQAGVDLVMGLIRGIMSMAMRVARAAIDLVLGAIRGAKDAMRGASPSKVAESMGMDFGEGLAIGIENMRNRVLDSVEGLIGMMNKALAPAMQLPLDKIREVIARFRGIDLQALIQPHLAAAQPAAAGLAQALAPAAPTVNLAVSDFSGIADIQQRVTEQAASKEINVNFEVFNPEPEPASDTAARKMRTLAWMGAFS
jgi:hypothetical protein